MFPSPGIRGSAHVAETTQRPARSPQFASPTTPVLPQITQLRMTGSFFQLLSMFCA